MTNILLVFTGGTIGSLAEGGTIQPSGLASYVLIEQFQQFFPAHQAVKFHTIQPLQILSENLAPSAWQVLVDAIHQAQPEQYDGVIITHGTDTLAYTSSMLSFCFAGCHVPLLLVSSDYPLQDQRANGLVNFICAVEYILQIGLTGVYVPYRNPKSVCDLHHGARLTSSLQLGGEFYSVQGKSLLKFINNQFSPGVVDITSLPVITDTVAGGAIKAQFCNKLLLIRPYPGLNYQHYNLEQVEVVIHDLYHSGTACVTTQWGENHSLLAFLKRCQSANIKVYLAPAVFSDNAYQSTRALFDEGAEMIWNMSIEAAYIKVLLAYGNFQEPSQRAHFIHHNVAGEQV